MDDATLGYVQLRSSQVFVTPTSGTGAIQRGVSVAVDGDVIDVENGIYSEANISVNKAVTIQGDSRGGVTVTPSVADGHDDSTFGGSPEQRLRHP